MDAGMRESVVKLLLSRGANVESRDSENRTALSHAAQGKAHSYQRNSKKQDAVIKLLLEQGVDADSKDSQGRTPLSYAAERGHEDAVKLLPARDLDVESVDKFCTTIVCRIEWIY